MTTLVFVHWCCKSAPGSLHVLLMYSTVTWAVGFFEVSQNPERHSGPSAWKRVQPYTISMTETTFRMLFLVLHGTTSRSWDMQAACFTTGIQFCSAFNGTRS